MEGRSRIQYRTGQSRTELDWFGLSGYWLISCVDSRWHCSCKSFGLRCLGKATGNLGEEEIKEDECDEADEERDRGRSQVVRGSEEMSWTKVSFVHSLTQ